MFAISKITLLLSFAWHILFYLFIPRFIELPNVVETRWVYDGLISYKDFTTFHFPLGRWILIPLYLISNWNLQVGPFAGLILNLACVAIIYKFGKKFLNKESTAIAIAFFTAFSWFLGTGIMFYEEMFVGLLLLIAFYIYINTYRSNNINPLKVFCFGLLISLAELSGQIGTLTLIILSLFYLALSFNKKINKAKIIKIFFSFTSGALMPLGLLALYFYKNSALQDFFEQNFLYYSVYANTYEKVPLLKLPIPELLLFYVPLATALVFIIYLKLSDKKINYLLVTSTVLTISTIPSIFFSVFHFHHLSYALPLIAVFCGLLLNELYKNKSLIRLVKIVVILVLLGLSIKILPWYIMRSSLTPTGRIANDMQIGDTMYQTVDWIRKNTNKNATILVAGDPLFYFSSQRRPSNKNAYVSPYNWEPLDKTFKEVNEQLPDYWIINRDYFLRLIREYKKEKMVRYIENSLLRNYSLKATFDDWEIWQRTN